MPLNEAFGWLWILIGFVSGFLLGLGFRGDEWMGGYGSFRRRLLRLGHVSFVGLGFLNILFALGTSRTVLGGQALSLASWALVAGGVTMPLCCGLMAWRRGFYPLFAVPVISLVVGAGLVVSGFFRP